MDAGWELMPNLRDNFPRLRLLDLSGNHIVCNHHFLAQDRRLKVLDLSFNRMKTLPRVFAKMKHLHELILTGNPFRESEIHLLRDAIPETAVVWEPVEAS